MNLWYETKRRLHWFKSVCSEWEGVAVGNTLFQFYLAAAKVCSVLFDSCEKLSVLMESAQFRLTGLEEGREMDIIPS